MTIKDQELAHVFLDCLYDNSFSYYYQNQDEKITLFFNGYLNCEDGKVSINQKGIDLIQEALKDKELLHIMRGDKEARNHNHSWQGPVIKYSKLMPNWKAGEVIYTKPQERRYAWEIDRYLEAVKKGDPKEIKQDAYSLFWDNKCLNIVNGIISEHKDFRKFHKQAESGKRSRCKAALNGKWTLRTINWSEDTGKFASIYWVCAGTNGNRYGFEIYANNESSNHMENFRCSGAPVENSLKFFRKEFFENLKKCTHQDLTVLLADAAIDNNPLLRNIF
jgi:hypothetical protein